jgi:thermitase
MARAAGLLVRIVRPNVAAFLRERQPLVWGTSVLVGVIAAFASIGFRLAINVAQLPWLGTTSERVASAAADVPWPVLLVAPAIGGLLVGWVLHFVPNRRGGGPADVIEAELLDPHRMSLRRSLIGALASAITLGSGGSAGREGPVVHLGGAVASWLARRLRMPQAGGRVLLGAGVASAIAASFNAPIAGALFAMEVVLRRVSAEALPPIVIASSIGAITGQMAFGAYPAFILPAPSIASYWEFPKALIEDVRLIPEIAAARVGQIEATPLPRERPATLSRRIRGPQAAIGLAEAHRRLRGEPDVVVAILDTGVDRSHPEIAGRSVAAADFVDIIPGARAFMDRAVPGTPSGRPSQDFTASELDPEDEVGHGTHVAGIVAGLGLGMGVGVAPGCRIMPVRVLAALERNGELVGAGLVENINAGVKHAIDAGAQVINMSLGVRHEGGGLPHEEVVDYARRKGVLIVAAAGNDGSETLYYPGAFPSVVAVGSADEAGEVSAFSTVGPQVALIAPGEQILSARPGGGYAFASGTSQAAPFVAGAAALIQSLARRAGGRFGDRELAGILKATADRRGHSLRDRRAGFGRLNVADALRLAETRINPRSRA